MLNIAESLRKQREQILSDTGEDLLSRHTSLLEIAIISLYNRLVNRIGGHVEAFRASGAVVAMAGFGRGLIGPLQPVPVLFLKAENPSMQESWTDEIILPLREAGWEILAEEGTCESLLERARDDFPFLLGLLDVRTISGHRALVDELEKGLEGFLEERQAELLDLLHAGVQERREHLDDPQYWMEPHLLENPGGLLDVAAIRAASRVASNIRCLQDAIFWGYLSKEEVDAVIGAEQTFQRLLNLQRHHTGNVSGVLRFEEQENLAEVLGFVAGNGFLAVEVFMRDVMRHLHAVESISHQFWERLWESRLAALAPAEDEESVAGGRTLEEGVLARGGKIHLLPGHYGPSAAGVAHLFVLAARHGLGLANVTRQWIAHHRPLLQDAAVQGEPQTMGELLDLIRADTPDLRVLRPFYDQGFLTTLVPELAGVHGLAQHDAFHLYPVHEHHLRTLSELKKLLTGGYATSEPELTEMACGVENPTALLLAGLLHDVGKVAGKDHAVRGGEMIPAIARRLNLSGDEADTLKFLVAQHLLLLDSASLRDLADEEMLAMCARTVGSTDRLDGLMLLSFADMKATGPKAVQKWQDTPILALYGMIRHILEKGEPSPQAIAVRIDHIRAQVERELAELIGREELEAHFAQLAPRYLLSTPAAAIGRHLRLAWELQGSGEPFALEICPTDGMVEFTLLSWQTAGLLARAAGILTLHDMNITGAQFYTMDNGMVLFVFLCRPSQREEGRALVCESIRMDMRRMLQGKLALDYRIAAHAARAPLSPRLLRLGPSNILIDNESSVLYTILEVYTVDRVGLLYTIARTLHELGIRISVAKITTKVDQVADVFYIRTQAGEKVTDPEQMAEIKEALRFWLDGPSH